MFHSESPPAKRPTDVYSLLAGLLSPDQSKSVPGLIKTADKITKGAMAGTYFTTDVCTAERFRTRGEKNGGRSLGMSSF